MTTYDSRCNIELRSAERRCKLINTRKVKGRMAELGLTQKNIACESVWNCALPTVSQKLNGIRPITLDEANLLADVLRVQSNDEYKEFFFAKVIA